MKKKGLLIIVSTLLLVSLLFAILILRPNPAIYENTDGISGVINSLQPRAIELDSITIKAQPESSTLCGITTVTVMSNYYNNTDLEPGDLIEKYNVKTTGGSSGDDMIRWLQGELPGRNINFKANGTDEEMIRDIHTSLKNDNPVVVFFGAPNPYNEPYYDSHGSVVYGIDLDRQTVTIANSYGYREEISLVEFLNRMSFTERDKYTSSQRFLWLFSNPNRNMYILVE